MTIQDRDPVGMCLLTLRRPRLHVVQADPLVYVAEELIDAITRGEGHPDVTYGDGILTIRADNGTVSYGLGLLDPALRWRLGTRSAAVGESKR